MGLLEFRRRPPQCAGLALRENSGVGPPAASWRHENYRETWGATCGGWFGSFPFTGYSHPQLQKGHTSPLVKSKNPSLLLWKHSS